MNLIEANAEAETLRIYLIGHIDSANAAQVEKEITEVRNAHPECTKMIIDASKLEYISSAGLRVILRLRKIYADLKLVNVSAEVYEVFDMTGFTEMMTVEKAYRVISTEGCEVIGQGANGKVYRIDRDTIVKVYMNPDSLPDIQRERELARHAFVLGIPTAIPYDVVRVGEGYGSVFELLNATSFAKWLAQKPEDLDEIVRESVDLLKKIHSTVVKPGEVPDMRKTALQWVTFLKDYLSPEKGEKLVAMVEAVPVDYHMMHGDYHIKNVMLQDGEALLIDMDTLCHGHPVFEFASIFNAYQGFSCADHTNIERFLGITYEQGAQLWNKTLKYYFEGRSEEEIAAIGDRAKIIGYSRILRRAYRRPDEENSAVIAFCKKEIEDLLERVDSLTWD
ncbi:MAG: STAS domain-containing protein [Erysipelotrichaceae bacterium]|nr:STAS domain-containing protein [Erysipelotrichaceae bacterium]